MLGKPVPDLSLPSTGGNPLRSSALRGTKLVLSFDPEFRERYGVSRESPKSHESFKAKLSNMYGKKVRGIERSTFVIDEKAMLAREWRGVKVPGHVEEILSFVKAL